MKVNGRCRLMYRQHRLIVSVDIGLQCTENDSLRQEYLFVAYQLADWTIHQSPHCSIADIIHVKSFSVSTTRHSSIRSSP